MEKVFTEILSKHDELTKKINSGNLHHDEFAKVSKELSSLQNVVSKINEYNAAQKNIIDLKSIINDGDADMKQMASDEISIIEKNIPNLEKAIKVALIPKDASDDKNVILEIRAGTGGDEAALFGAVLLKMYQKYAERNRWKFEILSLSENGIGGVKDCTVLIQGHGAFLRMKFESGTHRVQRVPETENNGRVHTSAATVAVLPEMDEIDIKIEEKDIKVDVFRSSGPGGQSVNTTDSAVRVTHIPSGIVVSQQDEKSQIKNREKAMKILRSRLYEYEEEKRNATMAADRKSQIGSGDRSEKIRTYNYPQGRVTDHRINFTAYQIDKITNEGNLDEFVDQLHAAYEAERLASMDI